MSHHVLIAIGSNSRQNAHIQWASQRLSSLIGHPVFSSILWTHDNNPASSHMYMNRLVAGTCDMTVDEIEQKLKAMEKETGRTREAVTLDLDLMSYDGVHYHLRDWPRPYIQQLLGEFVLTEQTGHILSQGNQ